MKTIHLPFAGAAMAAIVATPLLSQQQSGRMPSECRKEIVQLCGRDRSKIQACLKEKASELSEGCQTELKKRMEERAKQRESSTPPEGE